MKKKYYFGRLCAALTLALTTALIALAISNRPVSAAEEETPEYRIGITPTYAEMNDAEPGQSVDGTFKVQNTGAKDFDFSINITPYSVTDDRYGIDDSTETNYTQLSKWVKLSTESGTIPAGESRDIQYTINIPQDAPAGGQYALINVRMDQSNDTESGASISAAKQLGFRLLLNVSGNTRMTGVVKEQKISSILFNPPITATSTVENTGNTHVRATYTLQVFPLFSNEEVYTNEENPQEMTILPETSRYNSISWDGAPHLGVFRVRQVVSIANDTKELEKIVFLCPIWFIFIVLLLVFCLIFWVFSRIRGRA